MIVVDDHSTDRTREIAESFPVRVIEADPLPAGWSGKCKPCWSGAKVAKGKWLLFTDADTRHSPSSIASGLREAEEHGAALLSYSPKQEVHGFAERALMPVIFAELAATYRPQEVCDPASPVAAANGQYLLDSSRCLRRGRRSCGGGQSDSGRCGAGAQGEAGRLSSSVSGVGCGEYAHVPQLPADVGGVDEEPGAAVSPSARAGVTTRRWSSFADRRLALIDRGDSARNAELAMRSAGDAVQRSACWFSSTSEFERAHFDGFQTLWPFSGCRFSRFFCCTLTSHISVAR